MSNPFIIATRGSALALAQANMILAQCRAAFPAQDFELRIVRTTGDKLQAESSAEVDLPKGLFTKELEVALLEGKADLAVHSLKDLPTELPSGLVLGAVTERADVRDVVVYRAGSATMKGVADLPMGSVVATSSPRRKVQLLARNPRINVVPIRGNVPTRLRKLAEQTDIHALVLAMAGLKRLGYSFDSTGSITTLSGPEVPGGLAILTLSLDDMLPCVGQGALGIEIRDGDNRAKQICAALNDAASESCALAERAFLRAMGGGCQTPVAAYAQLTGDNIHLRAVSFESGQALYAERSGPKNTFEAIGCAAAAELKVKSR